MAETEERREKKDKEGMECENKAAVKQKNKDRSDEIKKREGEE